MIRSPTKEMSFVKHIVRQCLFGKGAVRGVVELNVEDVAVSGWDAGVADGVMVEIMFDH